MNEHDFGINIHKILQKSLSDYEWCNRNYYENDGNSNIRPDFFNKIPPKLIMLEQQYVQAYLEFQENYQKLQSYIEKIARLLGAHKNLLFIITLRDVNQCIAELRLNKQRLSNMAFEYHTTNDPHLNTLFVDPLSTFITDESLYDLINEHLKQYRAKMDVFLKIKEEFYSLIKGIFPKDFNEDYYVLNKPTIKLQFKQTEQFPERLYIFQLEHYKVNNIVSWPYDFVTLIDA